MRTTILIFLLSSFISTSAGGKVCYEWVDTLWDVIMLREPHRPARLIDLQRFFTFIDWDGDGRVSLTEFQGIFLPCTGMTVGDITELFNMFASKPVQPDKIMDSGSGLSGAEEEEIYLYYDYYGEQRHPVMASIGQKEIRKLWNVLHTDLSSFLKSLTGKDVITKTEFKDAWRRKILPQLTRKGCRLNQDLFERITMNHGSTICSLMSNSRLRPRFG